MFGTVLLVLIIVLIVLGIYIVPQQQSVVIERLGKFNRITGPGIHLLIPLIERKASQLSMKTDRLSFKLDAKTADNVTIVLEVSAQYHVDYDNGDGQPENSGVYRAFYTLAEPIAQMQDYLSDALRSSIPAYALDDVFSKKDDIARDVNANVSETMRSYGWVLVSTLITGINLPQPTPTRSSASRAPRPKPKPWKRPAAASPPSASPSPKASRIRSKRSRNRAFRKPRPTSSSCSPSGPR